jgi:hypothetical protein
MAVAKTKPFDMEDIDGTKPERETWGYIERERGCVRGEG